MSTTTQLRARVFTKYEEYMEQGGGLHAMEFYYDDEFHEDHVGRAGQDGEGGGLAVRRRDRGRQRTRHGGNEL